ncbi:MAG: bifunctional UDP-N-acetylmuramoyl-tripeptide:D-alanyl-D-alanine ligase/alanine racemase [Bacteroidota bacterium]
MPGLQQHWAAFPILKIQEVAFDTRRIFDPRHALFVALESGKRDGHDWVETAYNLGVRNFLVTDPLDLDVGETNVIVVEDTRFALQWTAAFFRGSFEFPVVGITGSNGKTIVKEWLATVLEKKMRVARSPKSYNSQIGVPLSLLEINSTAQREKLDLGIVEAGISQPGEMEVLAQMIWPEIGVMTHFGDAHSEGFEDKAEKLDEKMRLFQRCRRVYVSADDEMVLAKVRELGYPCRTVGFSKEADLRVEKAEMGPDGWKIKLKAEKGSFEFRFGIPGQAALENILLVMMVAGDLGLNLEELQAGMDELHPVSMRMEMITDNPELTILNDAYNADRVSVENAFSQLEGAQMHPGHALILSDLEHQGEGQPEVQARLLQEAIRRFGAGNIYLIGPVFADIGTENPEVHAFLDTDAFLDQFDYEAFRHRTVLLKGARKFALERCLPYLSRRAVATVFKVNLDALVHNFRQFRAHVPAKVRIMAMVKAAGYGAGAWEIADELASAGVDEFAVAYTSEGIALRGKAVKQPVMVMNADPQSLAQLYEFDLVPEVYNVAFLQDYVAVGKRLGRESFPVHIKVDTGMRRLGFDWRYPHSLNTILDDHPGIEIRSVLSHLSAADEARRDEHSHEQVKRFQSFWAGLLLPEDAAPRRHILNTAGILRFSKYNMDMVRVGIGLYGVSPIRNSPLGLVEIGSLHSHLTQIHAYPAGTAIGYGCSEVTRRASLIATVPVGYADGIRRHLSNGKASFLVRGQRAPVIGRICMDMLMLDVTDIPEAREGDEVVLLGRQGNERITVQELADLCETIPYEILTGISQRVRRLYVRE